MKRIAVLAITKNGIKISSRLKQIFPSWDIFAPLKFQDEIISANWYEEQTSRKMSELFRTYDGLICLFSLGAVIRLIAPYLKDKKTDPAVIVIDDKANFVISVLSGHLGGANELSEEIAGKIGAISVVTTAADVNKTIPVDMIGREFGWEIEDDSNVTKISAQMVNQEKIGIFQDAGEKNWWKSDLPENTTVYDSLERLLISDSKSYLIISDKIIDHEILKNSIVYRPKTLVVGIGLHGDTSKEKIKDSLDATLLNHHLAVKSVARLVSIKKPIDVQGLIDAAKDLQLKVEYFDRDELAKIKIPNPSQTVEAYEGTPSVSEAAAIKSSAGILLVEKQKFPPDLTIAIARIEND
ncbi:MAG: cobalt-precorrin 5A hydrolase [Candidatus Nitrosotenuis sp.]